MAHASPVFKKMLLWLVVSKIVYFHPYLGKIPNLTSMFFKGVETTNKFSKLEENVFFFTTFF